eukprot:NODE_3644_length_942_cov_18.171333_g3347_i0.p1 GENE.NODE_3644_length_942_cov_18.171333_g3347_i0~~NODE_3644_length_942_cov_18.171333_g3347_i0.p1  ORF type:complete len:244 (+),score=48.84 NODE_3644_length_942_cov_18.171333_g3347_i0:151-882(+)
MVALEVVAGSVAVLWMRKHFYGSEIVFCKRIQTDDESSPEGESEVLECAKDVKVWLLEGAKSSTDVDESDEHINDPAASKVLRAPRDEEELFGSGAKGMDLQTLVYENEKVLSVALYHEVIKPRVVFPILHPYVLLETPSWTYVLEKWRDGLAVSRFKRKEDAIRSRGKWFGPGRISRRRMPQLLQAKDNIELTTNELLAWSMDHPCFKQYTDNCHTFAANLSKKVGMGNPNGIWEELLYEQY